MAVQEEAVTKAACSAPHHHRARVGRGAMYIKTMCIRVFPASRAPSLSLAPSTLTHPKRTR